MSDNRKLYEVTVSFKFFAAAETPDAACDFAEDALRDAFVSEYTDAREVTHKNWPLGEWNSECLVYHAEGGDITMGSLLEKLPESVKAYKKEEK